jgi:hypothetical protein
MVRTETDATTGGGELGSADHLHLPPESMVPVLPNFPGLNP